MLSPGFVDHDSCRIGEIEAPVFGPHRQAKTLLLRQIIQNLLRYAAGFRAQQKCISDPK